MGIDLKARGFATKVIGTSRRESTALRAQNLGLIDEIVTKEKLIEKSDVILLSVPVNVLIDELIFVLDRIKPHQVVSDMGSTKNAIVESVRDHPMRKRYVAAHPMAGTENSGPEAALSGLFDNKVAIICNKEESDKDAVKMIESIFSVLSMKLRYMDAKSHDMHAAYVSHVSHITSFVLASAVLEKEKSESAILNMAAGGFESTVRLAKSSPIMWSQIFEQNDKNIIEVLETYISKMNQFKELIENKKFKELEGFMSEANAIKKILN